MGNGIPILKSARRLPEWLRVTLVISTLWPGQGCAGVSNPSSASLKQAQVNRVPDVEVMTSSGTPTRTQTVLEGHVALVSFWASWCDACEREMASLNELAAKASAREGALVVGVAVGDSPETTRRIVRERSLGFTQLVDREFRFSDALGEKRVPATLVIDRKGFIVHRGGALDHAALTAFFEALGR